jgi:uncharacterized ParB-like nuclease family protein
MAKKKKATSVAVIEDDKPAPPKVHPVQMIPAALLFEHPNNTNKQSKHVHQELIDSIQAHGFDEPIIVVPRTDGEPGYFVVSGNHRQRAGRAAGMEEFPAVVRDDWNEVEARIQLVRRNYVRGDIDRALFTEEINRLTSEHQLGLDIIMERMGFEDAEAFSEFYKEEKKRERSIGQAVAAQSNISQVKMLDDLGTILSVLFEKYGNTVPQSFIMFPYGGRNHVFVQITPALKKTLEAVTTKCVAEGIDINTVLGGLLQIAVHHTGFFKTRKGEEPMNEIVAEGSIQGDDNPELVVK